MSSLVRTFDVGDGGASGTVVAEANPRIKTGEPFRFKPVTKALVSMGVGKEAVEIDLEKIDGRKIKVLLDNAADPTEALLKSQAVKPLRKNAHTATQTMLERAGILNSQVSDSEIERKIRELVDDEPEAVDPPKKARTTRTAQPSTTNSAENRSSGSFDFEVQVSDNDDADPDHVDSDDSGSANQKITQVRPNEANTKQQAPSPAPVDVAEIENGLLKRLGLAQVLGREPRPPAVPVVFHMPSQQPTEDPGLLEVRYHQVLWNNDSLWLFYDTRWEYGVQYAPPSSQQLPPVVVPSLNKKFLFLLSNRKLCFRVGVLDIVVLLGTETSPADLTPPSQ